MASPLGRCIVLALRRTDWLVQRRSCAAGLVCAARPPCGAVCAALPCSLTDPCSRRLGESLGSTGQTEPVYYFLLTRPVGLRLCLPLPLSESIRFSSLAPKCVAWPILVESSRASGTRYMPTVLARRPPAWYASVRCAALEALSPRPLCLGAHPTTPSAVAVSAVGRLARSCSSSCSKLAGIYHCRAANCGLGLHTWRSVRSPGPGS